MSQIFTRSAVINRQSGVQRGDTVGYKYKEDNLQKKYIKFTLFWKMNSNQQELSTSSVLLSI